jgi:nucleotide-binding universal stress UspA family protein
MYKRLLVPVDGGELTERAMTQSIALARQLGASITAFVVEPDMPLPNAGTQPVAYRRQMSAHEARTDTHALELLSQFGERAQAAGVAFSGRHARTDQVDIAIARAAADLECDMIVMATHGRGMFGELLFGSHTKSVLAKITVPLLVLH